MRLLLVCLRLLLVFLSRLLLVFWGLLLVVCRLLVVVFWGLLLVLYEMLLTLLGLLLWGISLLGIHMCVSPLILRSLVCPLCATHKTGRVPFLVVDEDLLARTDRPEEPDGHVVRVIRFDPSLCIGASTTGMVDV
jgi:hypothetical protein